jgi:hypothetical protein
MTLMADKVLALRAERNQRRRERDSAIRRALQQLDAAQSGSGR